MIPTVSHAQDAPPNRHTRFTVRGQTRSERKPTAGQSARNTRNPLPWRRHPLIAAMLGLFGAGFVGWVSGFVWFLSVISTRPPLPPHTDGIVVLTGGAERVETALHLLVDGQAERLLVSGTGPSTDLKALAHRAAIDASQLADRVTLGRAAASTRGNALEAASWVGETGVRSLVVVTAFYHMPRTMNELVPMLPGVTLYPYPVRGENRRTATLRLLVEEYSKYLLSRCGVTAWLPRSEALRPMV